MYKRQFNQYVQQKITTPPATPSVKETRATTKFNANPIPLQTFVETYSMPQLGVIAGITILALSK